MVVSRAAGKCLIGNAEHAYDKGTRAHEQWVLLPFVSDGSTFRWLRSSLPRLLAPGSFTLIVAR